MATANLGGPYWSANARSRRPSPDIELNPFARRAVCPSKQDRDAVEVSRHDIGPAVPVEIAHDLRIATRADVDPLPGKHDPGRRVGHADESDDKNHWERDC